MAGAGLSRKIYIQMSMLRFFFLVIYHVRCQFLSGPAGENSCTFYVQGVYKQLVE